MNSCSSLPRIFCAQTIQPMMNDMSLHPYPKGAPTGCQISIRRCPKAWVDDKFPAKCSWKFKSKRGHWEVLLATHGCLMLYKILSRRRSPSSAASDSSRAPSASIILPKNARISRYSALRVLNSSRRRRNSHRVCQTAQSIWFFFPRVWPMSR